MTKLLANRYKALLLRTMVVFGFLVFLGIALPKSKAYACVDCSSAVSGFVFHDDARTGVFTIGSQWGGILYWSTPWGPPPYARTTSFNGTYGSDTYIMDFPPAAFADFLVPAGYEVTTPGCIVYTSGGITYCRTTAPYEPIANNYVGRVDVGFALPLVTPTPTPTPIPTPGPGQGSVDIKANGFDGPITISYNTAATLSWTSSNVTSCTASGNWSGSKPLTGSESTGNLTVSQNYIITCNAIAGGTVTDSVLVNVLPPPTTPPPAAVDIKANGFDGPISIAYNTAANLTWTSQSIISGTCVGSGSWSGSKADNNAAGQSTGNLTSSQTYTITCDIGRGNTVSDSVTVNVAATPTPVASPGSIALSGTCLSPTQIRWAWNPTTYADYWLQVNPNVGTRNTSAPEPGSLVNANTWNNWVGPVAFKDVTVSSGITYYAVIKGSTGASFTSWFPQPVLANNAVAVTCGGGLPNLQSQNLTPSDPSPTVGTPVTFSGQVINVGPGSNTVTTQARFCVSNSSFNVTDQTNCFDSGTGQVGSNRPVAALGAAGGVASVTSSTSWTATAGTHTVYLCADVNDDENETNENDNCTNIPLNVAVVPLPTVALRVNGKFSETIVSGQSATLSWTTTNANPGNSCTATGDWSGAKPSANPPAPAQTQSTGTLNTVKTYTYNLQCVGPGGNSNLATVTVVVNTPDTVLSAEGSFVAKGGFELWRDTGDVTQPSESFSERPDFLETILVVPNGGTTDPIKEVFLFTTYTWREVTP